MNNDYSLSDSYVSVGGSPMESVDAFARKWVAGHYMAAFSIIVVLSILLIGTWMFHSCKEKFMPGSTMKFQVRDDIERLDDGSAQADRSASYFASTQDGGVSSITVDPSAAAGQPGSLSYQVLHSSDFNCDARGKPTNDAWSWMNSVAHESFQATDNNFSRKLAGY